MRKALRLKRVSIVLGILRPRWSLALIGILSVTRGTPVKAVVAIGDKEGPPAVTDSLFSRTMELYTGLHLTRGNAVEQVNNGDVYTRALARPARGEAHHHRADVLLAARRGGRHDGEDPERARACRACGCCSCSTPSARRTSSEEWADSLRAAGVEIGLLRQLHWYTLHNASDPLARARGGGGRQGRATPGGFGLADYWLGDGRHKDQWRDSNVRFEGPAVMALQAAFAAAWAECTGELITGDTLLPQGARSSRTTVARGGGALHRADHGEHAAPSGSSRCRSPARERRCTSPTRTSSPTTTSGSC